MAKKQPFVHLHFHTQYSILDGACKIDQVMEAAEQMDMPAVAITDHGVMYGAIEFYKKAKSRGIKPILGCEMYLAPAGTTMFERKRGADGSQSNHFVLLAENEVGYQNLTKLVSRAHLDGFYYKPRIDKELLSQHSEGLIGLSACLKGDIAEHLVQDNIPGAIALAKEYSDILGKDNFYLEMMDHGMKEQRIVNERIVKVAKETGIPLIASNDVHYLAPNHYNAHDMMLCLQTATTMNDEKRMRYDSNQLFMKSPQEMYSLFPDHPDALYRTLEIAERCNVDLQLSEGEIHFPKFDIPEEHTEKSYLIHLAKIGFLKKYGIEDLDHPKNPDEKKVADRFYYELSVIEETGFVNYFLVVWDFIDYAKKQGIPVGPGRGSGAGSIVAYALDITGLDPLRYNLLFERFLNPERVSAPDFDIDFCQARRGEVIEYVKDKYGRDSVAQIITFGTLGAKTVIRDLGRALEIDLSFCDKFAKMVPEEPGMTIEKAFEKNPEFKTFAKSDPTARRIMEHAATLEGLPRQIGTHAAGVVIGEKPLIELIPLARDKNKEPVTQYGMKPLEQLGLLKMDFLGLKTLTLIQEAIKNIQNTTGIEIDPDTLPLDDQVTFDMLNRGETAGVFQVESEGMQKLLRGIQLNKFEELIAMIALYRPGPMNMIPDFTNRKHGRVPIKYDHPLLESILKETYGIMIYQEQVQQAANILAGFSYGAGDVLRRAMGKKDQKEMVSQRKKFIDGCKELNNIPASLAGSIFDNIERFADYGFNKSHSAAYAIISWQTAYLKAHYPVEFMAALLTSEINNTEKLQGYINSTQQMGIQVLPPSANESEANFTPVEKSIRFGLAGVKNVGISAVESLVEERKKNGPYESLIDFCIRVESQHTNKKVLESMVTCGSFDFTKISRGRQFNGIEFALARASDQAKDKASGQGSLFDMMESNDTDAPSVNELPDAPSWSQGQMLKGEKELLGFYISGHPLHEFEWTLKHLATVDTADLQKHVGTEVRVGGMVTHSVKRFTKKDQKAMGTFNIEHLDGTMEGVCFSEAYINYGLYLHDDTPVLCCGKLVKTDNEVFKIQADEVYPLGEAPKHFTQHVEMHLDANEKAEEALDLLKPVLRHHPGQTPVNFCLHYPSGETIRINSDPNFKVTPSEKLAKELQKILGEEHVETKVANRICKHQRQDKRKSWQRKSNFSSAAG